MSEKIGNIRLQAWVLVAGVLLMAVKFVAWRITHSNTVLSDAMESIVNVAAGSFALYSLILAAKPRDREHPYGHGKVEFISAAIEGTLVAVAGTIIIYRATVALFQGVEIHHLGPGTALIAFTGVANLALGLLLRNKGKRTHSLTMEAGGTHLLSDAWSSAALVLGLLVIQATGLNWLDSLFAVGFAAFIIRQGVQVVRRSIGGIMDETDMAVASDLVRIIEMNRRPAWIDMHNFRVITFGSTLHIDCHVTLPYYYSLDKAHSEISALDELVNQRSGREVEFFIHMDPCIPASCPVCQIMDCPVRQAPFVKRIPWTLATVLKNAKHGAEG
ncbi:MAG: cation transporter [Flavobacteriales bacterium]|jgi:cation diffusion facilitator family transporter|nr:cation transporter [Flavobacteriales bacterium]MBK6894314.1 cation transporter [Flavobacteriales bacterium]MBK7287406.1 cation transporter [Flavobacteriales bacterium]MBK9059567.1 cation transporter [Flavobacteriales bacterium]MBK9598072.1 cation transporter [Flavobacteriales bacterium]